eukprot:TRINITY_DN354_c2_g2_i3.p1 TRINITY_DN354_c2_g2~~TRINITY_DN354_c2_g2_i3.p1  ORF type:complete len:217 (-),score=99.92 TRINITY_DN354_c2_g2_i3:43-693(-)
MSINNQHLQNKDCNNSNNTFIFDSQNNHQNQQHQFNTEIENDSDFVIELNIGGKIFTTLRSTLLKEQNCIFHQLLTVNSNIMLDRENRIFMDYKTESFSKILQFLRKGKLPHKYDKLVRLKQEAIFFQMSHLENEVDKLLEEKEERRRAKAEAKLLAAQAAVHGPLVQKRKYDIKYLTNPSETDLAAYLGAGWDFLSEVVVQDQRIITISKGGKRQ